MPYVRFVFGLLNEPEMSVRFGWVRFALVRFGEPTLEPRRKKSSNTHHHSTRHKNEVSPKQINKIHGQNKVGKQSGKTKWENKVGKQLENGQRKCKATTSDE